MEGDIKIIMNNDFVRFKYGKKENLDNVPLLKGQILFVTDEKIFYLDIEDPNDASKIIRVSTYPEEIIDARVQTNSDGTIIYNSLKQRIDAIPYLKLISLASEVSIPYVDDENVSKEDTYSSSKIEDLMSWGTWT